MVHQCAESRQSFFPKTSMSVNGRPRFYDDKQILARLLLFLELVTIHCCSRLANYCFSVQQLRPAQEKRGCRDARTASQNSVAAGSRVLNRHVVPPLQAMLCANIDHLGRCTTERAHSPPNSVANSQSSQSVESSKLTCLLSQSLGSLGSVEALSRERYQKT